MIVKIVSVVDIHLRISNADLLRSHSSGYLAFIYLRSKTFICYVQGTETGNRIIV